jgi:hypothetical protein
MLSSPGSLVDDIVQVQIPPSFPSQNVNPTLVMDSVEATWAAHKFAPSSLLCIVHIDMITPWEHCILIRSQLESCSISV